jgi:PAS domain S-box-containing protein
MPAPARVQAALATHGTPIAEKAVKQMPRTSALLAPQPDVSFDSEEAGSFVSSYGGNPEGKKLQKRAANRKSAQLSRKRKKEFMDELKEENDDLRRKEQILKSIPDLILVFDSTGKLGFVSKSVSRILCFSSEQLEGTSIWERMCEDSVRLLKAAFMDSLAARQPDSDTAALGSGLWELRLVDLDGGHKIVTMNGVVHFAGERPECVCSIRPSDESPGGDKNTDAKDDHYRSLIRVIPQQSVVNRGTSQRKKSKSSSNGKGAVRISDSGGESETSSDSGSSDEQNVASITVS